jgi:hypothetical protein
VPINAPGCCDIHVNRMLPDRTGLQSHQGETPTARTLYGDVRRLAASADRRVQIRARPRACAGDGATDARAGHRGCVRAACERAEGASAGCCACRLIGFSSCESVARAGDGRPIRTASDYLQMAASSSCRTVFGASRHSRRTSRTSAGRSWAWATRLPSQPRSVSPVRRSRKTSVGCVWLQAL